ncbi:hypothetical protein ACIQUQ_12990 [Streptomyces sp. NPDC101118]|uniref:hypothetical protein n=1 Tax=Streptomyces sp. NPDC101118 TaxID=3366109 RepID=UPI0037F55F87
MAGLSPIDDGLPREAAELARSLRDLFDGLGVSMRRYAARRSYDPATVSRYLGGRRLPPWEFVLNLAHDVAEERGRTPTPETLTLLREQYAAAARTGGSPAHRAQLLERQLADADEEARQAAARERWLEEQLQDREHRIRDLEMRNVMLQAAADAPFSPEEDGGEDGGAGDDGERTRLRREIEELTAELTRLRALHRRAEERCEQLERQLARAEAEAPVEGSAEGVPAGTLVPVGRRDSGQGADGRVLPPWAVAGAAADGFHPQAVYRFGAVHGEVNVHLDGGRADEDYVASVTVQLLLADRFVAHGLMLDRRTALVVVPAGDLDRRWRGLRLLPRQHDLTVETYGGVRVGTTIEPHQDFGDGSGSRGAADLTAAVLHLAGDVPAPDRAPVPDRRFTPAGRLLVSAHESGVRHSLLLDTAGRFGNWLRVDGDLGPGLIGAPAFSGTGELAGLVVRAAEPPRSVRLAGGQQQQLPARRGMLLAASALRGLPGFDADESSG